MNNFLGIDFGLKKVGVAIAYSKFAEPIVVIRYETEEELFGKLKNIINKENPEKIIIGVSDAEMGEKSREFGELLKKEINIPVEFFDETLSTKDAQRMAIEAGMKRTKRKNMEDAWAAAVMLQGYLDEI